MRQNSAQKSYITRPQLTELTNVGFQLENFDVTEKLLIAWLKEYPSDLWMRYRLAIVLFKTGKTHDAIRLSELIVRYDPEFQEVWALLSALYPDGSEDRKAAKTRAQRLKKAEALSPDADSGAPLSFLKTVFRRNPGAKDVMLEDVDDFDIFSALKIAKDSFQDQDPESYRRLMNIYLRRWPHAIQFKLLYGEFLNQIGSIEEGTKLIHSTIESDLLGMVAVRLWGEKNSYRRLFFAPEELSVDLSGIPIPGKVVRAAKLEGVPGLWIAGDDLRQDEPLETELDGADESGDDSAQGEEAEDAPAVSVLEIEDSEPEKKANVPEDPAKAGVSCERKQAIKEEPKSFANWFFSLFRRKPTAESATELKEYVYKLDVANSDERFPIYVVLSTIGGLTAKYGKNNKDFIGKEMQLVAEAVDNREGWNAMVFYPDEFATNHRAYQDPTLIKQELVKLDRALSEKGSMIGAVLIVGGPEVVPFFSLKNPAMDDDLSIPSDAPYATFDETRIFDQQWQLGRIPGDNSSDPGLLLSQLRYIQNHHIHSAETEIRQRRKSRKTKKALSFSGFSKAIKESKTFGLSAQVWERPSVAVYRNIAGNGSLATSPGVTATNFPVSHLEECKYAYFNLHGIKGKPNWYGQKDPRDQSTLTMLPIALQMNNLDHLHRAPDVVFAENCYGAEIDKRNESNAISLHMIGKGTKVFIGSTTISYGAVTLPLTAADLLAHLFWQHLRTGISTGEAFRRAKKNFAAETEAESGGLDGEIQKTLLSFIFLGDPLFAADPDANITDRAQRAKTAKRYDLVRERLDSKIAIDSALAKQIFDKIRETYQIATLDDTYTSCTVQKQFRSGKSRNDPKKSGEETDYVIIYAKDIRQSDIVTRSLTRVTVSPNGEIRKVSFSR